jgi:uncharacterized protein YaaR (DUF327 family)
VNINGAWKTITVHINISAKESLGYHELKEQKPLFDEGYSELLDQRKQAQLQWLQDTNKINGDNLNNIRREARRHFKNKKREYMKDKIYELVTSTTKKNIRGLYK